MQISNYSGTNRKLSFAQLLNDKGAQVVKKQKTKLNALTDKERTVSAVSARYHWNNKCQNLCNKKFTSLIFMSVVGLPFFRFLVSR